MKLVIALSLALGVISSVGTSRADDLVIVVGAEGTEEYGQQFQTWSEAWQRLGKDRSWQTVLFSPDSLSETSETTEPQSEQTTQTQREKLVNYLKALPQSDNSSGSPLWLVMIGHGTDQQGLAKFNLAGPDISANDLSDALREIQRPLVVVNCASASAPFIAALSGRSRVIITATRSGAEQNFARFGEYLAEAVHDFSADLDHDRSISILEAFIAASAMTKAFYESEGRLVTEHALIDDNGDKQGTPSTFFRGTRVVETATDDKIPDGALAKQFILSRPSDLEELDAIQQAKINELLNQIEALRAQKPKLNEADYYSQLETLLVSLANLEVKP